MYQGRVKNIFVLLTSKYSIRPICRLNMDPEKFNNNAKMGEFDYLRLLKRRKIRREREEKTYFGNLTFLYWIETSSLQMQL